MIQGTFLADMLRGGSLWAGLASGGISQVQDTLAYSNKKMRADAFAASTAKNITGAFGTMAGVEYGALLGTTLIPGIGTAVGAVLGGFVGDRLGRYVGKQTGGLIFQTRMQPGDSPQQNLPAEKTAGMGI